MTDTRSAHDITVVIPCHNEAGALPGVLAAVPPGYRVIVVDNASTDDTAAVARAAGATVVSERTPGYGSAVHAGVCAAETPVIAVLDGDGSMDAGELPYLLGDLEPGVDMVAGRRRPIGSGAWPWHARLGNAVIAGMLRRRHGLPVHDIAAMRVIRREQLLELGALHPRSGYPLALLIGAARARWRIVERDISYRPRTHGVSKVSGSVTGTARAIRDFWSVR
ncbi:glycosyltransferase involved in cell wall biosynthesis [Nocardia transvalensis]|uniref:Glycosyltransferase involved in cell wall biosynthesis n=1 Tax=Nocardia transvalensis TaxID=37333 RepID=A0A7W9UG37_9NOCA|nr:glycosyltransferase family 2 protein [Nocardia transvalensis]MBB5911868.1 glycosyltransferase involved in cell wall biosynthesis [Nocardia transvalensis]